MRKAHSFREIEMAEEKEGRVWGKQGRRVERKEGRKNDIIKLVDVRIYNESILPSALESQQEALESYRKSF